jgi:hypothetical protein
MRRCLLGVLLAVLLVASTASASDWYCAARFGGMSNYYLYPIWMDDDVWGDYYYDGAWTPYMLRHIEGGIFDYRQFEIGLDKDPMFYELGFGWTSSNFEYNDPDSDYFETEKLSFYTVGLTGLYRFMNPNPIALDGGIRFQLNKAKAEWEWGVDDDTQTETHDIGGWSAGPVVRARWYFADGALALSPEIYFKYTSLTYEDIRDHGGRDEDVDEYDLSQMDTEYSLALEFHF